MLINNKSLINTINKLNLTDDEREKFNKISEDDRGNFLYNGKPVIGGATEAQAAQIQANKTAIGDSNSGLIKEVNDIKNTELQNLNTAIQRVNETVGDKTGLPSGDANVIASINRIDSKTSTGGTGLTSEQEAKLNSIDNKVDKIDGKGLSTNDYTTEEKTTLSNLKTAVGDTNSGLTKEVNNIKNTELQNLNTAIQTLETLVGVDETVGDKSGLPSGDANIIASINRIDNKPSGTVTDEQISTAVNNYLTEHPVSGGATAEQAAQIQANKAAIGDTNSGLIKEVNDLKNANGTSKNIYANNDMPTVFITSSALTNLKRKEDGSANCEFEIRFKNQIIRCFGTGAVQGNSSTKYPAKNYTFKFYSDKENTTKFKIDVGWGKQNKYCFKKNWVDSTHTRNLSGARIAYDMVNSRPESDFKTNLLSTPHNGSVDGFPTKVYVNGEFWGLYTWNIPKDAWMFNMDDKNPNHMVLCAEYNNNGNNTQNNTCEFRATWGGESDANWSIEVGTYSEALKNSFNNAISHVMNSSDEEFKTNFSNYFDLYSILDYYCFSYLAAHIDGLGKNVLMATYDGIHWGACLYDMDSIYGSEWSGKSFKKANIKCPEEYQETNSLLWQRVEKNFSQELHDRYFELRNGALSLGNIITHVEEIYNLIPDRVFNDDYQKWTDIPAQTSNTITRFRNYMKDRAVYCDECFKELLLNKSVTSVTISGESEVKIGSSITLTANLTPSNADVKTGSWSASNTNVTLNDSNSLSVVVNGSVLGSSTITFTSDDTTNGTISATHEINVVESSGGEETTVNVTSVSIDKTNPIIKIDESTILTATIIPSNATNKTVTWETNNANVSLTPNGLNCTVRGVTEGSSIITITTNDGNHTATSNVTITAKESSGGDQPAGILDASCISYNESYTTYDGDNTFTFKTGLPKWSGLSVSIDSGVFKPSTQYTIYCQLLEEELPDDVNNKACTWGVDTWYSETGKSVLYGLDSTMKSITFTTKDDITPIPNKDFIFLQFSNQLTGYMKVKFYIVEG